MKKELWPPIYLNLFLYQTRQKVDLSFPELVFLEFRKYRAQQLSQSHGFYTQLPHFPSDHGLSPRRLRVYIYKTGVITVHLSQR